VNGGLTDFAPSPESGFLLEHEQRHTLSVGFDVTLPRRAWIAGNVAYGSGFADNNGPGHLPGRTIVDFSLGKSVGEAWSFSVHGMNVANRRVLLDASQTFGGTHFTTPRQILGEVRYRFRY